MDLDGIVTLTLPFKNFDNIGHLIARRFQMDSQESLGIIWHSDENIQKYPLAVTDISLSYIYKILLLREYLQDDIHKDTLSIFGELLYRISEDKNLKKLLLNCFDEINKKRPIKNSDFEE